MTWVNRLKLLVGLVGVFALVAVLTVIFNQRQSQVASASASIQAAEYPVGTDYGGIVIERLVEEGDAVSAGQPMFTVQSPTLQADVAEGLVSLENVAYSVSPDGVLTLTASIDGTVTGITTERGSFVQAGQVLATINRGGSLYVSAQFVLTSTDYARIEEGAPVQIVLPNQARISGNLDTVEVTTVDGQAETTARVISTGLADGEFNGLVAPGTPVAATLSLRDDGPLAGVGDGFHGFLQTIGL
ncbi:efflux RND transporter periplasmic adaptor subunit [Cryobacterium sp. 1639]|uniref:HlyD family efflux transporter periplasmic adaptor subunit n=1 Tax=Cryobacterium inferilacus TaxID=2866629 RepID=UPI001C72F776|nr:HlyD family efflux transporter periplasmic adaptor subunit [Cryobacterium sp. 1639]MBX0299688.1 efflux RND transporter periplasmic adaptor subunit [Cryobacterium sp. 1639]